MIYLTHQKLKATAMLILPLCLLFMAGCNSTNEMPISANDPYYAPVLPVEKREHIAHTGSLFSVASSNSLYSDVTARRVGDIITVTLAENTNATKSANTRTLKESTANLNPIVGLGAQPIRIGKEAIQLGVDSSDEFTGDAQSNQSNSLRGNISVTVVQVLANRNLVIRGEKWLTLNNGDEYIRLTGVVRPADISPSNEIQSNKIANARIQYSGKGSFASAQEKGWLGKFFSSEWWPL